jgi:hypothetical protein
MDLASFNSIDEARFSEFVAKASEFAFQGFNPLSMHELLRSCEDDAETFKSDITSLVVFGATRGTKYLKALTRTKADAASQMRALLEKYSVEQTGGSGNSNRPTLGRIMNTYPALVVQIRVACNLPVVGVLPDGMPSSFAFPGAAALISTTDDDRYELWLEWANSFAVVIKSNNAGATDNYGRIMRESNALSPKVKAAVISKYWPSVDDSSLTPSGKSSSARKKTKGVI